ncbi:MAG TPA: ABC transporter ATP-binding protein [Rhodopila sp.]|uniref:ABC transporter ATP-binding protein n=1 Tax=Rhodopila sp. TaxID=2480087 RepID=UPI002CE09938|nr:ABC transporter ATP-binding protein [Rhodopila sp.]HVY15203.1 ABC transporter ATP-binding protein [Rhodopila sp.]
MTDIVLEIEKLTIALPAGADRPNAVTDVDLVLRAGEVTCLIGESGSGKSLVARSILGLLPGPHVRASGGRILFQGQDLLRAGPAEMRAIRGAGIAMIFQEPMTALNPLHTIGRQLEEVFRIHTNLSRPARRAKVVGLLESVHLPEPARLLRSYPHQLSGGQRQRALIAMALSCQPRLLIADEPTTALDVTTQAQILHLIRELQREHGTSVLFITHDFGVVADIADTVAVLRRGDLVEQGSAQAVLGRPKHPYTQALIAAVPKLTPPPVRLPSKAPFVIQARDVAKTYGARGPFGGRVTKALAGVEMELRRGETLGLVGESGSGKSTLARAVSRLLPVDDGEILLSGRDIAHLNRWQLRPIRKRIQMVFQDPYGSLDPRQRVVDIIAEGPIIHGAPAERARAEARELLGLVGLDASAANRFPHEFSGGQRQRIGIARALALRPEVLVADEPVSALDVSVQAQVLALLADIKTRLELSMLFVTHDLRVALRICDRIAVMKQGQVIEVAPTADIYAAPQHPYTKALFAAVPGANWQDRTAA